MSARFAITCRDKEAILSPKTDTPLSLWDLFKMRPMVGSLYCRINADKSKTPIYRFNGMLWEDWEPELDYHQGKALVDALDGKNLFLTGPGGCGKSLVSRRIIREFRKSGKKVAVTGSTGIAAVNTGGTTIHSFLGLGIARNIADMKKAISAERVSKVRERIKDVDLLLIDEISMLSGDYSDMVDAWLQTVMVRKEPFGGIQVVLSGDFLQLPSVVTKADEKHLKLRYVFQSESYARGQFKVHGFTRSYRQGTDAELKHHLDVVRFGKSYPDTLSYFNQRVKAKLDDPEPTKIFPLNADVDRANETHLAALPGRAYAYVPAFEGHPGFIEKLMANLPCENPLILCEGARVIFIKNNFKCGYANGTRGTIKDCTETSIVVQTKDAEIEVPKDEWSIRDSDDQPLATARQFPLQLAAACTTHRAQGMTLEAVSYDPRRTFDRGMAYCALSRVTKLSGLSLVAPLETEHIRASKLCVNFYREHGLYLSESS